MFVLLEDLNRGGRGRPVRLQYLQGQRDEAGTCDGEVHFPCCYRGLEAGDVGSERRNFAREARIRRFSSRVGVDYAGKSYALGLEVRRKEGTDGLEVGGKAGIHVRGLEECKVCS